MLTWSLRFEDKHNADNFIRIVQEESSLQAISELSTVNEAMSSEKVDTDHMSGNTLPNPLITDHDDDIPLASSDADTHQNIQITDDHSFKDNDQLIVSNNTSVYTTELVAGMEQNVVQNEQHRKKENKSEDLANMGDSSGDIKSTPQHS